MTFSRSGKQFRCAAHARDAAASKAPAREAMVAGASTSSRLWTTSSPPTSSSQRESKPPCQTSPPFVVSDLELSKTRQRRHEEVQVAASQPFPSQHPITSRSKPEAAAAGSSLLSEVGGEASSKPAVGSSSSSVIPTSALASRPLPLPLHIPPSALAQPQLPRHPHGQSALADALNLPHCRSASALAHQVPRHRLRSVLDA